MTTLTADQIPGRTFAQSFRAALLRFLDAILKIEAHDGSGSYVWGRGL
jgi:hypothetical protein